MILILKYVQEMFNIYTKLSLGGLQNIAQINWKIHFNIFLKLFSAQMQNTSHD